MRGITHLAVGTATAAVILKPEGIKECILAMALASVGSLINDIDAEKSTAAAVVYKGMIILITLIILLGSVSYYFNISISYKTLFYDLGPEQRKAVIAIGVILVLCIIGIFSKHRTFTHSIDGILLFSTPIYWMFGNLSLYFAIAMVSHTAIDLLNKKPVRLFVLVDKAVNLIAMAFKTSGLIARVLKYINKLMSESYCLYLVHSDNFVVNGILIFVSSGIIYTQLRSVIGII